MSAALPPSGDPNVVYLVDLSSLARGLFATLPPLQNAEGEPVAVTGAVVSKLVRLLVRQRPAFLGVCADMPTARGEEEEDVAARTRRSWRARLWSGYKAKREPPGGEYDAQIDRLIEIFQAHRIPVFQAPEREADDFFGALVPRLRRLGLRVVMVSKDQDLWQLVRHDVVAWDGNASEAAIGPAEVEAKYGVPPELLVDVLALAGDGDEAPGLPGIGVKRAAELVKKHRHFQIEDYSSASNTAQCAVVMNVPNAPNGSGGGTPTPIIDQGFRLGIGDTSTTWLGGRHRMPEGHLVPRPGEVLERVLARWQWALGAKGKMSKVAEALRDGRERALLSLRLVHLSEDIQVHLDLAELRVGWTVDDARRIREIGAELSIAALREVNGNEKAPLSEDLLRRWFEEEAGGG